MARRIDNNFSSYDFSSEEMLAATTFSTLQTQYLQTELSIAAHEKISLAAVTQEQTSIDDTTFRLAHEYCRGKMDMLSYLLQASEARVEEMKAALREQMEVEVELQRINQDQE
jgi:hypothetical protein